jgi:hypothetical protein
MPLIFLYMLIGVQSPGSCNNSDPDTTIICIPNAEIQSKFCKWIKVDFCSHMTDDLLNAIHPAGCDAIM